MTTPFDEHRDEMLRRYGWYILDVFNDPAYPNQTNIYTRGLPQHIGHTDLQLCLNISPKHAHGLLWGIYEHVLKPGRKLEAGKVYHDLVQGRVPIAVANAFSGELPVLRLILCDPLHCLDPAAMEPIYARQWDGTLPPYPPTH